MSEKQTLESSREGKGPRQEDVSKTISRDFDEEACEFCDRYKESGLSASSRILLGFVEEQDIHGKSLLDLGCGAGAFVIESLSKGVTSAVGIDLSPAMVKTASELAASKGYANSAKFEVGNAAKTDLPRSDIVVMDKVICCYPDFEELLVNAGQACRENLAFVIPRNEGPVSILLKVGTKIMNYFEKRRKGSLFYLHSIREIDEVLKRLGFDQGRKRGSRIWLAFLYQRRK